MNEEENAEAAERAPGSPGHTLNGLRAVEGISPDVPQSRGLLDGLLLLSSLMKLGRQRLADALAESLFEEAAGVAALAADKAFGLHAGLSGR